MSTGAFDPEDVLDRIEESVTVYDRDARLVYLNTAGTRPFGRPLHELVGKRPWDLVPSSTGPSPFRLALEAVLAGGPRTRTTSHIAAWDRWYDIDIYPHPIGAIVLARDVTATRRSHDELARSEARFRAIVQSSPGAMLIYDVSSGKFSDANCEAERLFGRSRDDLLALGPADVSWPTQPGNVDSRARIVEVLARLMAGETAELEWAAVDARGEQLALEVRARRLPSHDPVLVCASLFDITARARAQEQLQEIQRLDAVARLAGGVAHDFNNMLTVIIAGIQLAMNQLARDHPAREDLEGAMNAAERSALLTRQLLAFGRKQTAKPVALDLGGYIESVAPVLRRLVGEDVEIVLDLQRPLAHVRLDPAHVEQIVVNLVANARDAMPRGGRITLQTTNLTLDAVNARQHRTVPPGRYVVLAITDNGEGIPAAARPHIFEPFFTTKSLDRGTGLGLATVYGIVKSTGGHILVFSEIGSGTTFKIYLPRIDDEIVEGVTRHHTTSTDGVETILLVEDDDAVRGVLRKTLQRAGYDVLEAANAGEALLLVEQRTDRIDLMLTDVVMPRITGPQLAARLRPLRPDMRVIYISGYNEARLGDPEHAGTYDALISKPTTNEVLLSTIREVLDRPRSG